MPPASGGAPPPELLPAGPGSAVLCVAARRPSPRQAPDALLLTGLRPDAARELLGALIGAERVAAEPAAADAVVTATAGLPAALRTAAAQLTASGRPLAQWPGERPGPLFPMGPGAAEATGSAAAWADGLLTGPAARHAFRMLAVPDGEAISRDAAAALLDVPAARLAPVVAELVAAGLLTESGSGRYRYPGLLRGLARDLARRELPASGRDAALARLLACYLAKGRRIHQRRYPGDRLTDALTGGGRESGPPAGERPETPAGWADEMPQVLALVRQVAAEAATGAASGGSASGVRAHVTLRRAADLLLVAQPAAESSVYGAEFEPAARIVADRAALEGERRAEGRARLALAEAHAARGRFADAEAEVRRADRAGRAADDPVTGFRAPLAHGLIALHQGRFDDAERQLTPVWEGCRARRDTLGEAAVLAALARVWAAGGAGGDAILYAEWSVGAYQRVGRTPRRAHGLYALAEALAADGRNGGALRRISEALPLFEADGQDLWAARTRSRMAQAMISVIRPHDALTAAQDAAARLMMPGGERWRADALAVLGRAESALGHQQSAEAHWRDALAVYEEFDAAAEADEIRALLRDRPGSPAGTSRTSEWARAGTALRDLTAAVRVLRDRLRLHTAGRAASAAEARHLTTLAAAETGLAARLAAFARTGRPDEAAGSEEERLRAVAAQLAESEAADAGLTAAARDVARRLGR
ncbi:hypothetical protein LIU39_13480 [Streptomyces sp. SF28]|nr:hypothetical protein [Streptomyces pinistramenti]